MAKRASLDKPWGTPVLVKQLSGVKDESYIAVRADDLEMYISSNVGSSSTYVNDLFVSTRAKVTDPWGKPARATALNSTTGSVTEDDPTLRADGLEIFFTSDRTGGSGAAVWRATRKDLSSAWSTPVLVAECDTSSTEHSPAISGDGLTLVYASTRTGGTGSSDHYICTRPDVNSKFGTSRELKEINTTAWDHNGQQTVDGFSFYYCYNDPKRTPSLTRVYRADRILPVVWAPNGAPVRGQPFQIYVRRDAGNVGVLAGSLYKGKPITIPGITGTLDVNLSSLFWLSIAGMDAEGKMTVKLGVPNAPALKGFTIYFQGAGQDKTGTYLSPLFTTVIQ
jgi:hypothetical protein